jgi:phosphatidylglycerol:prolipoprotein diacylglycerol transferase
MVYSNKVVVWFEGLGLPQITLNKVAFTLFGTLEVRWYGILITLGILAAYFYASWRGKKNEGIIPDDLLDVGFATVILGIIGARAYYVLTSLEEYASFGEAIAIWNGGLAIYGGIIGGCLGILFAAALKKMNWKKLFDVIAPGVMLAQAIGRWGNFFNGEAYGYQITDTTRFYFFSKEFVLPSGEGTLFHTLRMGLYPNDVSSRYMVFVHPTFLYECVWNLLGFALINLCYKKKRFDGQIALMFFTWYGLGRMFIEGFRTDSLYIFDGAGAGGGVRVSQLIGLLCFVVGSVLLLTLWVRHGRKLSDFTTERELPVRRLTADGTVIIEEPVQQISQEESADETDDSEFEKQKTMLEALFAEDVSPSEEEDVSPSEEEGDETVPQEQIKAEETELSEEVEEASSENALEEEEKHGDEN